MSTIIQILFFAFFAITTTNLANAEPVHIKVLTLNVWGLPAFIVKDSKTRFKLIKKHIESGDYDFVFLQEAFSPRARLNIRTEELPYYVNGPWAHGRLQNSGLRILSKYKILRTASLGYSNCLKDDCLAHKGAVLVVVELPNKTKLNLVTTHLNARGGDSIRQMQLQQLKIFMDYYKEPNTPTLLAGDFNFGPDADPYQYVLNHFEVHDAWTQTRGSDPGFTYDTQENQYAYDYSRRHGFRAERNRIDFLFPSNEIKPLHTERLFTSDPLVSDHFGLMGEFEIY